MKTSSAICQTDTVNKVAIPRNYVINLIKDVEQGDMYKAELDTLSGMFVELHRKAQLQDTLIQEQKRYLKICHDGWDDCENMVAKQRQDMDKYKQEQKTIKNIGKGIILALVAALILK